MSQFGGSKVSSTKSTLHPSKTPMVMALAIFLVLSPSLTISKTSASILSGFRHTIKVPRSIWAIIYLTSKISISPRELSKIASALYKRFIIEEYKLSST
ncbi:hypothetical protein FOXYSP1_20979 [Fusarium oxysporum f. sp. phaseoli]